jgi:hypothetical protein
MEFGNMMFGNSRGEYEVPRDRGFEEELSRLFDSYAKDRDTSWREYGEPFENGTFFVSTYYWGDCTCGYEDADQKKIGYPEQHTKECLLCRPNFCYKPTEFELRWYKYPLRDSYMSQDLSLEEFKKIIDDCIESVKLKT